MVFLTYLIYIIEGIAAVGLIWVVTIQTTKNQGLSVAIGGQTSSTFKGKLGRDEQLNIITRYLAGAFFFSSLILALISR